MHALRVPGLAAASLVFFACATPGAGAGASPGRVADAAAVKLTFAWPEGLRGTLELRRTKVRGTTVAEEGVSTSAFRVEQAGGELRVVTERFEVQGGAPTAQLVAKVPVPVQVISADGRFLRLEGDDEAAETFVGLVAEGATDEEREQLAEVYRAALVNGAEQSWAMQVALWNGRELTLGKAEREDDVAMSSEMLGGGKLAVDYTLSADARVPCAQGEAEPRCVELSFESHPDASQLPALSSAVLEQMIGSSQLASQFKVEALEVMNRARLVTEPGTLVPHRFTVVRAMDVRVVAPDGRQHELRQEQRSEHLYRYE